MGSIGHGRDADPRDKYRQLKKALKAEFKALQECVRQGRMPRSDEVESFLGLAELAAADESAVRVEGLEEYRRANRVFYEECLALRGAAVRPEEFAGLLERLARRKHACHEQFT
jgi:XXXCH domain-containing protein